MLLNAPPSRVWKALTDNNELKQWYFVLEDFKPEVGFEFKFAVEHEGRNWVRLCRVTEVIPNKKLSYTWRYEGIPGDTLLTFELILEGGEDKAAPYAFRIGNIPYRHTRACSRKFRYRLGAF